MSSAATTLCVASQRVFIVAVNFVIDSVRKRLDTPSYISVRMNYFRYSSSTRKFTVALHVNDKSYKLSESYGELYH
jgi:hypothetical protein